MRFGLGNQTTLLAYGLRSRSSCCPVIFMCWGTVSFSKLHFFSFLFPSPSLGFSPHLFSMRFYSSHPQIYSFRSRRIYSIVHICGERKYSCHCVVTHTHTQKHSHFIDKTFPISNILNYIYIHPSLNDSSFFLFRWQTNTEPKTTTRFCTFSLTDFHTDLYICVYETEKECIKVYSNATTTKKNRIEKI